MVLMAPLCCIVLKEVKNSLVCSWVGNTGGGSMSIIRASIASLIDSESSSLSWSVPSYSVIYCLAYLSKRWLSLSLNFFLDSSRSSLECLDDQQPSLRQTKQRFFGDAYRPDEDDCVLRGDRGYCLW